MSIEGGVFHRVTRPRGDLAIDQVQDLHGGADGQAARHTHGLPRVHAGECHANEVDYLLSRRRCACPSAEPWHQQGVGSRARRQRHRDCQDGHRAAAERDGLAGEHLVWSLGLRQLRRHDRLVLRSVNELKKSIHSFVRPDGNRSPGRRHGEDWQRRIADQGAISCQGFGGMQYGPAATRSSTGTDWSCILPITLAAAPGAIELAVALVMQSPSRRTFKPSADVGDLPAKTRVLMNEGCAAARADIDASAGARWLTALPGIAGFLKPNRQRLRPRNAA